MPLPGDQFRGDPRAFTPEAANEATQGYYPGLLGIEFLTVGDGSMHARLPVRPELLAPNGFLHAGAVVGFADTICGFGCRTVLPEDAVGFTTIELKTNFLGTLTEGALLCEAHMLHGGRTTQVWDATVTDEKTGRKVAVFRCTQLVLYPR